MATDNQILASIETVIDSIDTLSNGPFVLQGYDRREDKLYFKDEDGHMWKVNRDGSNPEQSNDVISGATTKGAMYKGDFFYASGQSSWHYVDLEAGDYPSGETGYEKEINTGGIGSDVCVKLEYDPTGERLIALFENNDYYICPEVSGSVITWESSFGTVGMFCTLHDVTNSDASVGGIWLIKDRSPAGGSETLLYHSIDNHVDSASDELHTLDLLGFGSAITAIHEIVDMFYDDEAGVVYLMIDEDGAGTTTLYKFTHSEQVVPSGITAVLSVSADAQTPATFMVPYYDSYSYDDLTGIADLSPTCWLDAADVTSGGATPSDGATFDAWPDKSGNGNDVQTIGGSPVYDESHGALNNLPTVRFGGASYLVLPDGTVGWPFCVFIVFDVDDPPSFREYFLSFGDISSTDKTFGFAVEDNERLAIWSNEDPDYAQIIVGSAHRANAGVGNIVAMNGRRHPVGYFQAKFKTIDPDRTTFDEHQPFSMPDDAGLNSPQVIGAIPNNTLPSVTQLFVGNMAEIVLFDRTLRQEEFMFVWETLKTKYSL